MKFVLKQYRDGKLIATAEARNTFTKEGATHMLKRWLENQADEEWYVGLVSTGSVSIGDTAATKTLTEFTGYFFERDDLAAGSPPTQEIQDGEQQVNFSAGSYVINTAGTIRGVFVENWDNDSALPSPWILWAGASLSSPLSVSPSDLVTIDTYYVKATANDSAGNP